jgi:hypothetical protein
MPNYRPSDVTIELRRFEVLLELYLHEGDALHPTHWLCEGVRKIHDRLGDDIMDELAEEPHHCAELYVQLIDASPFSKAEALAAAEQLLAAVSFHRAYFEVADVCDWYMYKYPKKRLRRKKRHAG